MENRPESTCFFDCPEEYKDEKGRMVFNRFECVNSPYARPHDTEAVWIMSVENCASMDIVYICPNPM